MKNEPRCLFSSDVPTCLLVVVLLIVAFIQGISFREERAK